MGSKLSVSNSETAPTCDESMMVKKDYHLQFHHVHGDNIKLSKNRTVASRSEGFCKGIVFSDRPITIGEPVCVKFLETSTNWHGALRIGFTMNDPLYMKSELSRYACPDLCSMRGSWTISVSEKLAKKDSILYYYVDQNGVFHFGIDFEEHGNFRGVSISGNLWAVLDIYGNTVAVELLDPNSFNEDYQNFPQSNSITLQIHENPRYEPILKPLLFHSFHGENVMLKRNRSVVSRKTGLHTLAYAFTERPVEIGKIILMNVLQTDHYFDGCLTYGITSCDPKTIDPHELPENTDDLLDRPEYWVVKHKTYSYEIGDTMKFGIGNHGEVEFILNEVPEPLFYVDHTQPLWFFINLSYSVSELQLAGVLCNSSSVEQCLNDALNNMKLKDTGKIDTMSDSCRKCIICFEEQVDCALYRCGHMCMCYECALKLFNSGSNALCPICRSLINDVIKIYK